MNLHSKLLLWGQNRIEKGAWFLAPFSVLWGFVSFWKNLFYDCRWLKIHKVDCPVISVGNLVAGGTGKTPLVQLLSSRFSHLRVAIISRGYGKILDEPLLLQRRLQQAKVYVGKDRVKLANQAVNDGADLIILDDGFQHRKLHRDFDLVLLAGSDLFGKGHYLPWGFLRDSPKRLKSADAIFVSGKSDFSLPHIELGTHVDRILNVQGARIDSIQGLDVAIFCGISKPKLFKKTVLQLGANVVSEWVLADHEKAFYKPLREFALSAKDFGAKALLCTEKDMVKLDPSMELPLPIYYLEISLQVEGGNLLWENLIAKIDQKIDTYKL